MAVADEIAAQAAKDALQKELQGKFNIEDAFAQARQAATASNQTVLDQLTQNAADYQDQFNKDARSAYINKMQSGLKLEGELSRLGLGNAGYGVTQRLMNESAYGTNLANLQDALSKNLRAIDQSKAQAQTDLGNTLADLALKQSDRQSSINQYIFDQLQKAYDTAYNKSYNERQDAADRALQYAKLNASISASKNITNNSKASSTESTTKKKWYVPTDAVKTFVKNAKVLKTSDARENFIMAALAKGNITENDLDYIYNQLGL